MKGKNFSHVIARLMKKGKSFNRVIASRLQNRRGNLSLPFWNFSDIREKSEICYGRIPTQPDGCSE